MIQQRTFIGFLGRLTAAQAAQKAIDAAAIVLLLFAGLWLLSAALLPPVAWFPAGAAAIIASGYWMNVIRGWLDD